MDSRISQIISACERTESIMVSVYLLEQKHFLFCNNKLKKILNDGCHRLIRKGWEHWFSIIEPKEVIHIKNRIIDFCSPPYSQGQMTLQYHVKNGHQKKLCIKHELLLHKMGHRHIAINYFYDISDKEKIEHCFVPVLESSRCASTEKKVFTISARERQVLMLIGEGFSSKEIADKLYISDHTAVSHRKNLIEKFRVRNTAHLIREASKLLDI